MGGRVWTAGEVRTLRRIYATHTVAECAAKLGRTDKSVTGQAKKLGLRNECRFWSAAEIEVVRLKYDTMTIRNLARELGRKEKGVAWIARKLGLHEPRRPWPQELSDLIRQRNADGLSDEEISAEWSAVHPEQPIDRRTLRDVRAKLGLPHNAYSAHRRAAVAAKTAEQLRAAGVKSLAEVRAKMFREYSAERGWPDWLRPREAQILDVLYEVGPLTRDQIAVAIGMNTARHQRYLLSSKYGRGSYLANLMAAGFVVRSERREVFRKGLGNSQYRYWVASDIQRGNPATWPEKEVALERIYGEAGASHGAGGYAGSAVAGGDDVSGAPTSGGGRECVGDGRPSGGPRHCVAS